MTKKLGFRDSLLDGVGITADCHEKKETPKHEDTMKSFHTIDCMSVGFDKAGRWCRLWAGLGDPAIPVPWGSYFRCSGGGSGIAAPPTGHGKRGWPRDRETACHGSFAWLTQRRRSSRSFHPPTRGTKNPENLQVILCHNMTRN